MILPPCRGAPSCRPSTHEGRPRIESALHCRPSCGRGQAGQGGAPGAGVGGAGRELGARRRGSRLETSERTGHVPTAGGPLYNPALSYFDNVCVTMVGMERMRVLSVRVPVVFWVRCRAAAVGRGLGLSEWVRLVLWEALEGEGR